MTTLILYADGHEDDDEIVSFYSDAIPRVGDNVHYYTDGAHNQANMLPQGTVTKVSGPVARVTINYRDMIGHRVLILAEVHITNPEVERIE